MPEFVSEETRWAVETRRELRRRAEEGRWWRLPAEERKAEYRSLIRDRLERVPPRQRPTCLAALKEQVPHWRFSGGHAPPPQAGPDDLVERLAGAAAGYSPEDKARLLRRLQETLGVEDKPQRFPLPLGVAEKLKLDAGTEVDPERIWVLLLEMVDALQKNLDTAAAVYNEVKPDNVASMPAPRLLPLVGRLLGPEAAPEIATTFRQDHGSKTCRDLLRAMRTAPHFFCEEHAPLINPTMIMAGVRANNDGAEAEDFWSFYVERSKLRTRDEVKMAVRDAIYKCYRQFASPAS